MHVQRQGANSLGCSAVGHQQEAEQRLCRMLASLEYTNFPGDFSTGAQQGHGKQGRGCAQPALTLLMVRSLSGQQRRFGEGASPSGVCTGQHDLEEEDSALHPEFLPVVCGWRLLLSSQPTAGSPGTLTYGWSSSSVAKPWVLLWWLRSFSSPEVFAAVSFPF